MKMLQQENTEIVKYYYKDFLMNTRSFLPLPPIFLKHLWGKTVGEQRGNAKVMWRIEFFYFLFLTISYHGK